MLKKKSLDLAKWHMPIVPATEEAEVGGRLEPRRGVQGCSEVAMIVPLHSSMGDRARSLKKKKKV